MFIHDLRTRFNTREAPLNKTNTILFMKKLPYFTIKICRSFGEWMLNEKELSHGLNQHNPTKLVVITFLFMHCR